MPLILEDIPRHQHVVFPVELEMQLENTIKGGTEEQLCKLMEQVMDNYLKIPGSGPMGQNLELLRCIVLRCLDDKCGGEQSVRIMNQVQHVKTASDMERCIFDTWRYFADKKEQTDDQDEELKKKIAELLAQKPHTPAEIAEKIEAEKERVSEVIQYLLEEGEWKMQDGMIHISK